MATEQLEEQTLTQLTISTQAVTERNSEDENEIEPHVQLDNEEVDQHRQNEAVTEEIELQEERPMIYKKRQSLPPKIKAPIPPTPPTDPPPSVPYKLHRQSSPRKLAPAPPAFPDTNNAQLIIINSDKNIQVPPLRDYTSMTCCFIFFFGYTGLSIAAYYKARGAVNAYDKGDYETYEKLNRQARSYMIASVIIAMILSLILIVVALMSDVGDEPTTETQEIPDT